MSNAAQRAHIPPPGAGGGDLGFELRLAQARATAVGRGAISARITEMDRRFNHGRERMDELDDRIREQSGVLEPLKPLPAEVARQSRELSPLPSQVKTLETDFASLRSSAIKYRNAGLYFIGLTLLSLVLSGRMTVEQFFKIAGALGKAML